MDWRSLGIGVGTGLVTGNPIAGAAAYGASKMAGGGGGDGGSGDGRSFWDKIKGGLFGGLGASTNPGDYNVQLKNEGRVTDLINRGIGRVENRTAPQLNMGPQDQFRAMQMAQAQQLQNIATGQQKGAGELAAERQAQNALAAQQAFASMRGAGGAGQLAAARQGAAIGSTAAGMGRQAALQDQQAAQGMLAQALGTGRGQDLGAAGQNAQLAQQQMALDDAAWANYINSLSDLDRIRLQGQLAAMQTATQKPGLIGPLLSTGGQIAGAAIMASDENLKTNIKPAGYQVDEMLAQLQPKEYRYKDPGKHGDGRRLGILAQDLLRSDLGKEIVRPLPDGSGLGVDPQKALSAVLASAARLHERVARLEAEERDEGRKMPPSPPKTFVFGPRFLGGR